MNATIFDWRKATSEFFIIVFGVLAALAVDEWREDRRDRATEAEYLARIHADLELDIQEFTEFIRIYEIKAQIIKELRDYDEAMLGRQDSEDLLQNLVFSSYRGLPAIRSTTFDELSSTGLLALIQDIAIRDSLSRYYTRYDLLSRIHSTSWGGYIVILQNSLPGELFFDWRISRQLDDPTNIKIGVENMVSTPGFVAAANSEITYTASLISYLQEYIEVANNILELLDS